MFKLYSLTQEVNLRYHSLSEISKSDFKYKVFNKKSAESGVAPAGIKSHKFLFELKKKTILQYSRD